MYSEIYHQIPRPWEGEPWLEFSMLFRVIPCYSVALLPLPKTSPVSNINVLKRLFIESSVRAPACSLTSNPPEMLANRLVRANNTEWRSERNQWLDRWIHGRPRWYRPLPISPPHLFLLPHQCSLNYHSSFLHWLLLAFDVAWNRNWLLMGL